jgi:hypothetical protein
LAAYWELIIKIWRFEKKNSSKSGEFVPFKSLLYDRSSVWVEIIFFSSKFGEIPPNHTHTGLASSSASSSSAFFLQLLLTKIIRKFHEFLMTEASFGLLPKPVALLTKKL